jgi:hypothetical protein
MGRVYSDDELGKIFGFKPYYLRTTGGMVSVPKQDSILLITHTDKEASFEYGDYWDGEDLIYTGRGQTGDQKLSGPNRDVAENRRHLLLFERYVSHRRRFLGHVTCAGCWWGIAPDKDGLQRRVLRFCLRFQFTAPEKLYSSQPPRQHVRQSRPFDEARLPSPVTPGVPSKTPDQIAQLNEKASAAHHALLVALKRWLEANGWTHIEEIPAAVDLWARRSDVRVILEAKTLTAESELTQTRAALAQLLEYRFFHGNSADHLCLVTDSPISDRKLRFLCALGIHCLWHHDQIFTLCGNVSQALSPRALSH